MCIKCKIIAVEKCTGIWELLLGPLCHAWHSRRFFKNKANGIPASLSFPLETSGHGEKQGEGM